jgi:hypothetical protein
MQARLLAVRQRHEFELVLREFEAFDLLDSVQDMLAGEERLEFLRELDIFKPVAFRRGGVMPDGYILSIFYGDECVKEFLPSFVSRVVEANFYVLGIDRFFRSEEEGKSRSDSALAMVDGRALKLILDRLVSKLRHGYDWPLNIFFAKRNLSAGVVFDEFAGTPFVRGGDDKRIFEVGAWGELSGGRN